MTAAGPDFVMLGPSKTGSSWRHRALEEHPDVFLPELKPVNYFNVKYHLGEDWYRSVFENAPEEAILGDSSPPYFVNEHAPYRIAEDLGEVKALATLRNPIDRALSHWWHDTSHEQKVVNCDFEDLLFIDQMYEVYVRMSMYATHLERWFDALGRENVKVTLFDDFKEDNLSFVQDIYEFLGIDATYEPSVAGQPVNTAKSDEPEFYKNLVRWFVNDAPNALRQAARPVYPLAQRVFESGESEYEKGLDPELRKELELVFAPETARLADLLDRDLNHWFEHVDLNAGDYRSQVDFPEDHKRYYRHWESSHVVQKEIERSMGAVNTRR